MAGPSQAPISPEKEKTPPPKSPEKEKTPPPKSPEPGNVSVTMEDEEDAFLYATASHVEEQAVAKRVEEGVEKTQTVSRMEKKVVVKKDGGGTGGINFNLTNSSIGKVEIHHHYH